MAKSQRKEKQGVIRVGKYCRLMDQVGEMGTKLPVQIANQEGRQAIVIINQFPSTPTHQSPSLFPSSHS